MKFCYVKFDLPATVFALAFCNHGQSFQVLRGISRKLSLCDDGIVECLNDLGNVGLVKTLIGDHVAAGCL